MLCHYCKRLNTTLSSLNLKAVDGADNGTLKAMQLRQCDDGVAVLLITTQSLTSQEQETLKATADSLELASLYMGINTQDGNSLYCDEVTLIHGASRLSKNIAGKDFYVLALKPLCKLIMTFVSSSMELL